MLLAVARQVQVDVHGLALVSGFVVPLIVGLITKLRAHRAIKAISLAVLSAAAGVLALALKDNGAIDLWTSVDTISAAFVGAVSSYYGFWKPTGIAPAIAGATGDVGLGSNDPSSSLSDNTYVEPTSTAGPIDATTGTGSTATPGDPNDVLYKGEHYRPKGSA